jgi:hypothetical protein
MDMLSTGMKFNAEDFSDSKMMKVPTFEKTTSNIERMAKEIVGKAAHQME